jgi:NAD(P)-dependent dehydrogenase (short-subunit alcohol dehydrogenase family)
MPDSEEIGMSDDLAGKVAVVTGAGRGVGRAYAHALAERGVRVVVNDLNDGADASPADHVVSEIEERGGYGVANCDDISDYEGAGRMVSAALQAFGRLDIVVANAGIIRPALLRNSSPEDWNATFAVHATGTFNCIRQSTQHLIDGGGGTIITTGDVTTDLLFPMNGAYRAAKAAVAVTTLYAADELRDYNINVNSVMPGATATRMVQTYMNSLGARADAFTSDVVRRRDKIAQEADPAAPETVPPLGIFLCTSQARWITGKLFQVNAGQIRYVTSTTQARFVRADDGLWTADALAEQIPRLIADPDRAKV